MGCVLAGKLPPSARIAVLGITFGLDALENLVPVHWQLPGRLDTDLDLATAHTKNLHHDVVANHDYLTDFPSQNKH
jgi:hypothetical protein